MRVRDLKDLLNTIDDQCTIILDNTPWSPRLAEADDFTVEKIDDISLPLRGMVFKIRCFVP